MLSRFKDDFLRFSNHKVRGGDIRLDRATAMTRPESSSSRRPRIADSTNAAQHKTHSSTHLVEFNGCTNEPEFCGERVRSEHAASSCRSGSMMSGLLDPRCRYWAGRSRVTQFDIGSRGKVAQVHTIAFETSVSTKRSL